MFDNLRADTRCLRRIKKKPFPWYVLESLLFENGYQAVVLYRIASWFKQRGVPVLGPLFARLCLGLTGVDIAPAAEIGPGLMVSHGSGLVIGNSVKIGANAVLLQQVTIGAPSLRQLANMPRIGDNVFVGAGARIIGDVEVGDSVFIGTNAVVTESVASNSKVTSTAGIEVATRRESPGPNA